MTHLELIELLYKHKIDINEAYLNKSSNLANDELLKTTLLIKVADEYQLNKNYISFVNSVLDRVDYGMVFDDYKAQHSKLIRYKNRFIHDKKSFYKESILKLVDEIYLRFFYRDNHIKLLLKKLEHDVSLDIDIIIDEANVILNDISELIEANHKIYQTFSELKQIDKDIKERLLKLDSSFYSFSTNIEHYINQLKKFVIQTKEKRRQNRLFMKVADDILKEDDSYLLEYLRTNQKSLFYAIEYTQRKKVKTLPSFYDEKFLKKSLKTLELIKSKKILANEKLNIPKVQKLQMIDIENIIKKLKNNKPKDLYSFLLTLDEFRGDKNEVFKIYLHLLSYSNIVYKENFNQHGIKVVSWV
jgi:hypothetical protein